MNRREFLTATGLWVAAGAVGRGQDGPADITLRIGELTLDLAPKRSVKTLAYNGQVPGPMLRARMGRPLTIDVMNGTSEPETVHWHGFHIPSDVDGAIEEGTPAVPPRGRRRYVITPAPAGTRWYHSHGMAGSSLKRSTYTGQFGMFVVESGDDPGAYDQEVPILLHEWEPRFSTAGPLEVEYRYYSVNGKMLGAGDPVRVREGQRLLFRIVNASATLNHRLALAGHTFLVVALDGNPVPTPARVPSLALGPGERVDAIVEMDRPGTWILGEIDDEQRTSGLGIVVEYAGQPGTPRWLPAPNFTWDYTSFGGGGSVPEPDGRIPLVFKARSDGHHWTINGKEYPRTDPILVQPNKRYRLIFDNQSAEAHPVHLHRHSFELVRVEDVSVSGILKDVVVVPAWKQIEVELRTSNPGLSLLHCHQQFHMDMGFMTMMRYTA